MTVHPSTLALLRFFEYEHLPPHLRRVSRPFGLLATDLVYDENLTGAEVSAGLRKLLEAKDCFVRAAVVAANP